MYFYYLYAVYRFCRSSIPGDYIRLKVSYETFNKYIHEIGEYLFENLQEISTDLLDLTKHTGIFSDCPAIVDTIEFKVQRPGQEWFQQRIYSGKKKTHTLKYQIIINSTNRYILHVYGPVRGCMSDLKVFKRSGFQIPDGFFLLGDKAYLGEPQIIIPHKGINLVGKKKVQFNTF